VEGGQTRRRFLQAGAGAAIGVATANTGVLGQALAATRKAGSDAIYPGELRLFAGGYVPDGFLGCHGQEVLASEHERLAKAIGKRFGGDDKGHIELPDLRSRAAVGDGEVPGGPKRKVGDYGPGFVARHQDAGPSRLGLTYFIDPGEVVDDVLAAEVRSFAFGFVPEDSDNNWLPCDGRTVSISRYTLLFSIIEDRYGGDGRKDFKLPDLRGYTPVGHGNPPNLPATALGEHHENLAAGGAERRPRLHVNFCIATRGRYPQRPQQ
jgi:microcystin-dependent protein